ncbi:unnamed protein product [Schistosoma curassoni]|uniref:Uncharacterized protein n=1 Tax=Schistosoma curassoni TaxID=6186 RepID=A0A183KKJ0_9TREM|nr:unnamed protein product [Schistosoma curassoni]
MLVNEGNIEYGLKKKSDFLEVGTPDGSRRSSTHRCSDVNLNTHRRSAQEDSFMSKRFCCDRLIFSKSCKIYNSKYDVKKVFNVTVANNCFIYRWKCIRIVFKKR